MTVSETDTEYQRELPRDESILEIRNASVTFDMDRGESRVLDDVDLDIQRNEILGVVGESGSGKSMLASALLDAIVDPGALFGDITYYPPDDDPIDILDLDKQGLKELRWEEISMVFQGAMSSFNPVRKIRTHFVETLDAHDYDIDEGMERTRGILEDLYLDPERVLDSYPHELSGGMKQRALIALSLVLEPEVLVMDEPTAALDLLMQRSIISLIQEIKEEYDLTIVFITHDLPLVADIADRIGVLYAFEFVELGPTDEILADAAHPYTRLLLKSTPNLEAPIETMQPVEGSAPDPVNVPSGCSFHPRCPLADAQCHDEDPGPYEVHASHHVHCHHWEDARDEIPMTHDLEGVSTGVDGESAMTDPGATPSRTDSAEPVVSLEDVEVHFEKEQGFLDVFSEPDVVEAVDGVSLDIYENDVIVLVGESGCGKTTLGKTTVGLQEPTGGRVTYRGHDIWDVKAGDEDSISWSEVRQSLQIVHQDPGSALNPHRRVKSSLEAPLKRWNGDLDGNDRRQRILSLLEHVGMTPPEDYIERYPHQLSGGEQQRVALIRAMLMNPDLIMADEPVSALDVSLRVEMMDLMIQLQDTFDTSYLFVSHDLSNARYIAEKTGGRIGVVYLGRLVEIGPPEQIIHNPQHPYTQALCWATPELGADTDGESPIREIDIPDPTDPPSGCRYHTRCANARQVCQNQDPAAYDVPDDDLHEAACFRVEDDHEYWDSESITGDEDPIAADDD
ncbi:dipeptide ABC transporter ATP-binding protein [Natrinema salifodinae]|uniref:Peptide/nickel transport system ATP-binding protein n=1 Tax=Natrinema salifodinae TaxID=1202768 RepID=A0A1I0QV69_9EURY|nr:dipeptide ABC transporter ATP-binding protein [Natrinema salifodinae]SEW31342.1 peptide/nickel transport system ATP-binding protein [Natrinema salifodinae]